MDSIKSARTPPAEQAGARDAEQRLALKSMTLEAIFKLLEKVGSTQDVRKVAQLFLMTLMGQLGLRLTSCYLIRPGKKTLGEFYSLGLAESGSLPVFDMRSGFAKWLVSLEDPDHIDAFYSFCPEHERDEAALVGTLAERGFGYAYPLRDHEGLLGAIFFSGRVSGASFSGFETELIKMLTAVAMIAIKKAWLYQMALLSKLELEKFAEVKKEFMNHTSHELRTPLTVLRSALWSIEPGEIGENIMVEMAKDAVQSLQNIVEYLLSLNEIELKKTDLRMELVDISSLLDDCLRELLPELEEKGVRVKVDDGARYRKTVVDPSKIKVVLKSMLGNALEFVAQGGNISIETSISDTPPREGEGVEIGDWYRVLEEQFGGGLFADLRQEAVHPEHDEGDQQFARTELPSYYVIRIRDDGIGIPQEEISTLAEPFKRATNSTLRNVKGLGIGLSVSQKIIAGHGGRIFCQSSEGQGSLFSIWLPMISDGYWDEP